MKTWLTICALLAASTACAETECALLKQVLTRALVRIAEDDAAESARGTLSPSVAPVRTIELKPGVRRLTETMTFDGASADGLCIRGAADGSSELTGEEIVPAAAFTRPPADLLARFPKPVRDRVVCADVKELDSLASYGVGVPRRAGVLLFTADDEPRALRHARWPNAGCLPATMTNGVMRFREPAPRLPAGARALAYGYWRYRWADAALPVETTADGGFRPLEEHCYGFSKDPIVALAGVPEAADEPGEWCAVGDRLCLVRPDGPFAGVRVSRLSGPLLRFSRAKNVRLENVRLTGVRGDALDAADCSGLALRNVSVLRAGGAGAVVRNCDGASLERCVFADAGFDALRISGGDRRTLRSGGMSVRDCDFRRPGRLQRTYVPAILLEGCGGRVAGCSFADTPSSAMRIEGNEHLVRDCVFMRTVLESDDQGAIDLWGDPTYRGNVFYRNAFRGVGGDSNNGCGRAAIRLDDMISGMAVVSNVFDNCAQGNFGAIQMNGGHFNAVVGNHFRNCARDVTMQEWPQEKWDRVLATDETKRKRAIAENNPVYASRYPEMPLVGTRRGAQLMTGNVFEKKK